METAGAASLGGLVETRADRAGQPCENCGHVHTAEYCPRCGQLQASFKRPLLYLIIEGIKDSFSLDGRLWRTFPLLWFKPGRLTRDYLDGKRARYVPPFRMFLLSSLIFFLTLFSMPGFQFASFGDETAGSPVTAFAEGFEDGAAGRPGRAEADPLDAPAPPEAPAATEEANTTAPQELPRSPPVRERESEFWGAAAIPRFERIRESVERPEVLGDVVQRFAPTIAPVQRSLFTVATDFVSNVDGGLTDNLDFTTVLEGLPLGGNNGIIIGRAGADEGEWFIDEDTFDYAQMERDIRGSTTLSEFWESQLVWLMTRVGRAYENPQLFENVLREWAPRVAFLQMPLFAIFLSMLYFWRRKVFIYDHVITSLHLQSFFYQFTIVALLIGLWVGWWVAIAFVFVPPAYIYRQMRVGYGDGRIMAFLRMSILIALAIVVFAMLMLLLTLAGLADMN